MGGGVLMHVHVCAHMQKLPAAQPVRRLGDTLQEPGKKEGTFPRSRLPGKMAIQVAHLSQKSRQKNESWGRQ